ncbi:MAG: hypothetical protein V2A79_09750 [Planctomycetota bacterium]
MTSANHNGAGNWIVKSLNGMGLLAILGAVALGALEWGNVKRLESDVAVHCKEQQQKWSSQQQLDREQDKIVEMYNQALVRIEAQTEGMKDQLGEIKQMLRERP